MIYFFKKYWIFILLGLVVCFLYTYNISRNSRFIWDESRALVDMHRIWEQKKITFVGPISSDQLEMFPSLSYFMYMPATVLTNFDPLGPAYMSAFYGLFGWLILTITLIKIFGVGTKSVLLSLLVATLAPVMIASRWAWNPNLIIFWFSIFIATTYSKKPLLWAFGGLALGASLYHHYLAALGVVPAILFLPILYFKTKDFWQKILFTAGGFIVSIIPFSLFEMKNHYFHNSSTFLSANEKSFLSVSFTGILDRLWNALVVFATMFVPNNLYMIISFLAILVIIFITYRKDRLIQYSFLTLLISLLLFCIVKFTYPHYQYSEVPFAILFIIQFFYLNKGILGKIFICLLLAFSLTNAYKLIKSYTWQGDVEAVRNVTKIILAERNLKTNIAVLVSKDPNLTGQRYRDMALINGKVLDAFNMYPQSKVLYVVSGTSDVNTLRQDRAWELESFKGSKITNTWQVSDFPHYLYRFEK